MRILVTVASRHGSTTQIGETIGHELQDKGLAVDIAPPGAVQSLADYDAVILGSAVYEDHWLAPAKDFAIRFRDELAKRPVWLLSSGPVGKSATSQDKDPADVAAIRRDIHPRDHHVFAGKLDPNALKFPHISQVLFHSMSGDFRDWDEISRWADDIASQLSV
jgi:menaquinone-dependent protoporphyrinogen oxidase